MVALFYVVINVRTTKGIYIYIYNFTVLVRLAFDLLYHLSLICSTYRFNILYDLRLETLHLVPHICV